MARFGFGMGFGSQSSAFAPLLGSTTRNFTTLSAAGSKDYTIPSISLTGDFEVSGEFTKGDTGTQVLTGSDGSNYIGDVGGSWTVRIGTDTETFGTVSAEDDGKLHTWKFTRVGSTTEFFIDDVSRGTASTQTSTFTLTRIGSIGSSYWKAGVISEVKITDAGTLDRYYKIDETWDGPSTVLVDYGSDGSNGTAVNITNADSEPFTLVGDDWLGAGLWTHGDVSAVAATSGFVGGVSVTVVSGYSYKFFYDVAGFVNGSTTAIATAAGASRTANGSYTDIITSTGTTAGWDVATNPTTLDVDSGEIKRILEAP